MTCPLMRAVLTSRSRATGTAGVGLDVLGGGPVAGALAGRTGTAGAAGAGDGVLLGGLVAGAVQGGLLAAGALSLLGCVLLSENGHGMKRSVQHWIVSVDLPQTQVSPLPQQVEDLAVSVAIVEMSEIGWSERVGGCLTDWFVKTIVTEGEGWLSICGCVMVSWVYEQRCGENASRCIYIGLP